MTTHRTLRLVGTLALSGLTALGCGNAAPTADDSADEAAAAIEQPNGAMTTADEAPEFGDGNFASLPELSATGADATLDEAGSFAGDAAPAAERHVFRVLVLWGHLPSPRDAAPPATPAPPAAVDWSGSVSIDGGRIAVRRTVGFEDGDRVAPRTDPARVAFTSHTRPFVDGLALTVRAPADAAVLHLATAAGSFDLALPDADGDVLRLGDGRNGVYYAAYEERPDCGQGFVFGHWARLRPQLGVFRGHVIDAAGAPRGAVRGVWGATRRGEHAFFGKHISNTGAFNGLLGGTYDDGHFRGAWGLRDGQRGELHGRYFDGVERADGRGVLLGRWSERCAVR